MVFEQTINEIHGEKEMTSAEKEMAPHIGANQKAEHIICNYNIQMEISCKDLIGNLTKKFQPFLGQYQSSLSATSKEGE